MIKPLKAKKMKFKFIVITALTLCVLGCQKTKPELTPAEAQEIAKEAYVYGFPLAMNYKTLYAYTLDKDSKEYKGEFNIKSCEARYIHQMIKPL